MRDLYEGISVRDPTVVKRKQKCQLVIDELGVQPVRLVRAPPGSGKTSFRALLQQYGENSGLVVRSLDMSLWVASGSSLQAYWKKKTGTDMDDDLEPDRSEQRLIIIDEAQRLYHLGQDHPFWSALKGINAAAGSMARPSVRVLLLAVYGLRARSDQVGMPIDIPSYSMSLLRLDAQEREAFFSAYSSTCEERGYPAVSAALQDAMQRVCNGHVGLLRACMRAFRDTFKGRASVTPQDETDFVALRLLNLGASNELRALPALTSLTPAEAAQIVRVARAGGRVVLKDKELSEFPTTLITAGAFDMESVADGTAVEFASPAMSAHALRFLYSDRARRPMLERDLESGATFIRAVVKCMRQDDLRGSLSTAADGTLLERQYQMSFYA